MDFQGWVVVITGAGSGIGRAVSEAFAAEGARVQLVDVDAARLDEVARSIAHAGGVSASHICDCTDAEALAALARTIHDREGRVDLVHNNAGVGHAGDIEHTSLDDWRWVLDLNLRGVIYGIHAFLPFMLAQGRGHFLNTASMAGLIGAARMAPYCASKYAVVGLSESLDMELAPRGIRVTAICPGLIKTRIHKDGRFNLSADLHAHSQNMFEQYGGRPEALAQAILGAVRKKKRLLTFGRGTVFLWRVKRLCRPLYFAIVGWVDRLQKKRARGASPGGEERISASPQGHAES